MRMSKIVPAMLTLGFLSSVADAGRGVAELALDRGAVRGLIEAALPEPLRLSVPGLGSVTLSVDPPRRVEFREGGVEALLPFTVAEIDFSGSFELRYVPAVEPQTGVVRLAAESIVPVTGLPFRVELDGWLGTVELPRRLDWTVELERDKGLDLTCFVQGLKVEDDRLLLDLGLVTHIDGRHERSSEP